MNQTKIRKHEQEVRRSIGSLSTDQLEEQLELIQISRYEISNELRKRYNKEANKFADKVMSD